MNNNDIFSIDRLVEFGLGMAMAQQMVRVMNDSMQQMYIPGSIQSMPKAAQPTAQQTTAQQTPIAQIYYVALDGHSVGPLNDSELSQLVTQHKVNKDTLAWVPGMTTWLPIEQVPAILKVIALTPPPIIQQPSSAQ